MEYMRLGNSLDYTYEVLLESSVETLSQLADRITAQSRKEDFVYQERLDCIGQTPCCVVW